VTGLLLFPSFMPKNGRERRTSAGRNGSPPAPYTENLGWPPNCGPASLEGRTAGTAWPIWWTRHTPTVQHGLPAARGYLLGMRCLRIWRTGTGAGLRSVRNRP
jgi:hypothetical protein